MRKKWFLPFMILLVLFFGYSCDESDGTEGIDLVEIGDFPTSGSDVKLVVVNTNGKVENVSDDTGDLPESRGFSTIRRSASQHRSDIIGRGFKEWTPSPGKTFVSGTAAANISRNISRATVTSSTTSYAHVYNNIGATVTVTRVYSGTHCLVFSEKQTVMDYVDALAWIEVNKDIDDSIYDSEGYIDWDYIVTVWQNGEIADVNWDVLGAEFDSNYEKMVAKFGEPADIDGNGKVVITYFDMVEHSPESGSDFTSVCGYFNNGDFYAQFNMNNMDVINMNLTWSGAFFVMSQTMKSTLVHEFQHLINESNRQYADGTIMDTWLDEGLAQSAEELCYGILTDRVAQFNDDTDGVDKDLVKNGNSLVLFENDYADYSMSYLFMQYARMQCEGDESIYKSLISHENGDYRSITGIMESKATGFSSFSDVVSGYYLANLLNQDTGKFGYYKHFTGENALNVASPSSSVKELPPSSSLYINSDLGAIESTLRLGKQGDNISYYLAVDGEVYAVKDGSWVKQ